MMTIHYATTNIDKFHKAEHHLGSLGIKLEQTPLELEELQIDDGEEITRHKLHQAYTVLQSPVIVGDDSWSIPALHGFPGTNMKQCNHYLQSEDWLRLMNGVEDRRIFLNAYIGFSNGKKSRVFMYQREAYFLQAPQGSHAKAPHLTVVAWKNEQRSIAECISQGIINEQESETVWKELASVIHASEK